MNDKPAKKCVYEGGHSYNTNVIFNGDNNVYVIVNSCRSCGDVFQTEVNNEKKRKTTK